MNLLLPTILFVSTLVPLYAQTSTCLPPGDSVWINQRFPKETQAYKNRTTLIFEGVYPDTVSILVNDQRIAREYLQSSSAGRVFKEFTIHPSQGKIVTIKTMTNGCTEFILRKGYRYIYINQDEEHKWFVIYSKYKRAYY